MGLFGTQKISQGQAQDAVAMVEQYFRRRGLDPNEHCLKDAAGYGWWITEGSAKIRSGPPTDEPDDYDLPIWAGVLPASVTLGAPIADPRNKDGADTPDHAKGVARIAGQA